MKLGNGIILLTLTLGLSGLANIASAQKPAPANQIAPNAQTTPVQTTPVTVRAAQRGNPHMNFLDGHAVSTNYVGASRMANAQPLALSSADFDEDGVPDLVSGYASGDGTGMVTVHRGNVNALWPYGAAILNGSPPEFLPDAKIFSLPEQPDFVGVGDFNADGHWDIVVAHRGSNLMWILLGDGHGNFSAPQSVQLTGGVTALITGEINRADGMNDIVVGVNGSNGPQVLVFEAPNGAIHATPEIISAPSQVTALALGRIDGSPYLDLAIGAGNQLMMVHGRDRKLTLNSDARASVGMPNIVQQTLPFSVRALAVGNFSGLANLAALGDDGAVHLLENSHAIGNLARQTGNPAASTSASGGSGGGRGASSAAAPLTGGRVSRQQTLARAAAQRAASFHSVGTGAIVQPEWTVSEQIALPSSAAGTDVFSGQLIAARVSTSPTDDLLVMDHAASQIHVLSNSAEWDATSRATSAVTNPTGAMTHTASFDVTSAPAAVLPMRLNKHAMQSLVVLSDGQAIPSVAPSSPLVTLVVTNTSDAKEGPPNSLRAWIQFINGAGVFAEIDFNIPLSDPGCDQNTHVCTIRPVSEGAAGSGDDFAMTPLESMFTIDAYTQPGASPNTLSGGDNAVVLIRLEGSAATTPGGTGFDLFEIPSTIRGFNIAGWNHQDLNSNPGFGDGAFGIDLFSVSAFVEGNFIGTNPSGTASDAHADQNFDGVFLENGPSFGSGAFGNVIGGTTPQARNIISGNDTGIFSEFDALLSQIQGNFIGTDKTGTLALGNLVDGILVPPFSTVGGTQPGAGNLISTNRSNDVDINAINGAGLGVSALVQGNFIGTDVTGTNLFPLDNAGAVKISVNYQSATIGGTTPAARNIISGSSVGVELLDGVFDNLIQGNYIGTDVTGTKALGNLQTGILSDNADLNLKIGLNPLVITGLPPYSNTIGGAVPGAGNLISGNAGSGIKLSGANIFVSPTSAQGDVIQGNLIGTDATGTHPIPNGGNGIWLTSSTIDNNGTVVPTNNIIGGTDAGLANLISNNLGHGVFIDSGTANPTVGNVIQNNGGAGVRITGGSGNLISRNSIFGNGALGIDLDTAGPNANSPCQANTAGANLLQNAPVLTAGSGSTIISATATDPGGNTSEFSNSVQGSSTGNVLSLLGNFNGKASTNFTIEFFSSPSADASGFGQGQTFLGSTTVTSNASCTAPISLPVNTTQADVAVTLSLSVLNNFLVGPDFGRNVYTAVVANNGAATAHNVTFTDPLPAALKVSSTYCNLPSCQSPVTTTVGTCVVTANNITCNLGTMAAGATGTIKIPVQALIAGSTTNTVNVSATETDPNLANNLASLTSNILNPPPVPDSIVPTNIVAGSPDLSVMIFGINFLPTTVIKFNGTILPTTFFDNQQCGGGPLSNASYCAALQVVVPAAMLTTPGDANIIAVNGTSTSFPTTFSGFVESSCQFNVLSPISPASVGVDGEVIQITTQSLAPNCSWKASSSVPWITLLDSDLAAGGSRSGSSRATYSIAPNNTGAARSGTITQAGQITTFNEAAGTPCTFALTPPSIELSSAAATGSITVTASDPGCLWQAQSFSNSIAVTLGGGGTVGNGTVNYSVPANTGGPLIGSIVIESINAGGSAFTITQDAPNNCFFTLSSTSSAIPTPGGTGTFAITASQPTCAWTANSDSAFANITSGASGTGNGTVNFTVASNAGNGRTANITVANTLGSSAVFSANQISAFTCTFVLQPPTIHFSSDGGTGTIGGTQSYSFCNYNVQSNNPDALLVDVSSGTFGTPVPYTVAQNNGPARVLTLTIACQTFTVNQDGVAPGNPVPAITSLAPPSVAVAASDFSLTVNGANFVNGATVLFNGLPRVTTFVNSGQLTAAIFAHDVDLAGTRTVVVSNPVPGGGVSNSVTFNVTGSNPVPAITTLSPANGIAGTNAFALTVNGTGFDSASFVTFGGTARVTTFVSSTQLTAAILASDIATAGTPAVVVTNPTPGGGPSNSVTFAVTSPVPTLTSISPTTVVAGSGLLVMSLQGTNFVNGSTVNFGSIPEVTLFQNSPFFILAIINAADVANPGTPLVTITNPGGSPSNGITFTITGTGTGNPLPSISALSPNGATAGSGAFTLTVTGANFVSGATVNFNGTPRTTTFGSATQLTAAISAADVLSAGTPAVSVTNPTPGGGTSNSINFNISVANNPAPAISSLVPNATTAGGANFSLVVNGSNFISTSTVNFNGTPRATTFNSASQITAAILAADIATAGSASITVTNPAPGGGTSTAATLAINNPFPTVTTLSPTSGLAGGASFTLTVNGTGFVSNSVVNFNHIARATSFTNSTQLTAAILASDIATSGADLVTVTDPTPGGGTSTNNVTFQVNNPAPTITTLSPTTTSAGSTAFTLTINGSNFVTGATASFGGVTRGTTVQSSTQLTIQILPVDVATVGTPAVTITNPTPGGGTSNAVNFNVTAAANPLPTVGSLSPTGVIVSSGALTLTVNGTNFVSTSVVNFGGSARATSFVSATQLTAAILSTDVISVGTPAITVTNPTPGGGTSNPVNFNISAAPNPVPTITTLSTTSAIAGSGAFTLTVNGTNFLNTSVVNFGGASRATTFVSATQITAAILAADVAIAGTPSVTITNPAPGGGTSNAVTFTVNNPQPVTTSMTPSTVSAGSAGFTLTVNGSNFISASVVQWNGSARTTTFVSATQLTAAITAADVQTASVVNVSVRNPAPGGGNSLSLQFSVTTPIPALGSLVPNSAVAGGAAFTLTVNGSNFINTSVVQWNGSTRATTFASATQLTAAITAADIATAGTSSVTVFTPAVNLGGGASPLGQPTGTTSNALTFTITAPNPVPTLTTISPTTAGAGGSAFTLTLTGTNFINGSTANWKGSARTTTFISATQLTAAITAADIASPGTAAITVVNPTPGGGTSNSLTLTITDFSVSATTTSQTVTAGGPANFAIATAAVGGAFPGTVTFTASGLPIGAAATFNPTSVSVGTSTSMTITTTARTLSQIKTPPYKPTTPLRPLWLISFVMLLALATASLAKFGKRATRRLIPIAAFALLLISISYVSGCSGGGFPRVGSNTSTPAGTFTVTVTGTSGTDAHTTTVTLVVQ